MLEVARDEIDIWLVDDRQVEETTLLSSYMDMLTAQERARHQRFIFSRHRHQFLIARATMRVVLSQYLGQTPAKVDIQTNRLGKPVLGNNTDLQFNLSHTNSQIAIAVVKAIPVGIDVEYLSRRADVVRLAERYFSAQESAALAALPASEQNDRFYDLWTLKEAYLKACGYGLRTPLDQFGFTVEDGNISISFSDQLEDEPAHWQFWQLTLNDHYRLALALNGINNEQAVKSSDYRLRIRQGVPLTGFSECELPLTRQSLR